MFVSYDWFIIIYLFLFTSLFKMAVCTRISIFVFNLKYSLIKLFKNKSKSNNNNNNWGKNWVKNEEFNH